MRKSNRKSTNTYDKDEASKSLAKQHRKNVVSLPTASSKAPTFAVNKPTVAARVRKDAETALVQVEHGKAEEKHGIRHLAHALFSFADATWPKPNWADFTDKTRNNAARNAFLNTFIATVLGSRPGMQKDGTERSVTASLRKEQDAYDSRISSIRQSFRLLLALVKMNARWNGSDWQVPARNYIGKDDVPMSETAKAKYLDIGSPIYVTRNTATGPALVTITPTNADVLRKVYPPKRPAATDTGETVNLSVGHLLGQAKGFAPVPLLTLLASVRANLDPTKGKDGSLDFGEPLTREEQKGMADVIAAFNAKMAAHIKEVKENVLGKAANA